MDAHKQVALRGRKEMRECRSQRIYRQEAGRPPQVSISRLDLEAGRAKR